MARRRSPAPRLRCLALGGVLGGALVAAAGPARAVSPPPLLCAGGMVVSESPEASRVGAEILLRGGNAVDAAVAVHFALAVAYPQAGNLGGGGFMLVRMADGTAEAIDFREVAPGAAARDLFLRADGTPDPQLSTVTHLAAAVPGSVAGMGMAHERHATRTWSELLAPAQELAARGFALDAYTAGHLAAHRARLEAHPASRRVLLNEGRLWAEGDTLRQPDLAATLSRIARFGPREFYEG
ncbi:MAG: gamma-glutamyltransferase, partial [Candidatus Eisenbacteria bacterium]|nr:gamma-glutamyltransferase [Candidatus Eisenbacteria bacterium]